MARYRLRTESGQQYVWEGSYAELVQELHWSAGAKVSFLTCPGGTLVNVAHVEAFEPIEGA